MAKDACRADRTVAPAPDLVLASAIAPRAGGGVEDDGGVGGEAGGGSSGGAGTVGRSRWKPIIYIFLYLCMYVLVNICNLQYI